MSLMKFLPKGQYRYYFTKLNQRQQQGYLALLQGFMEQQTEISVALSVEEVEKIHHYLCFDVPELFFLKELQMQYQKNIPQNCTVLPSYRFPLAECEEMLLEMEEKTAPLLQEAARLSELEREKLFHDYLVQRITYRDPGAPYSHEGAGPLLYDVGVCDGISKAFKYLSDRAGLAAAVIGGTATEEGGHAWNAVRIDGQWYHLDVTFDLSISDAQVIRYDYFNLSDGEISGDHQAEEAPFCPKGMAYYVTIDRFAASKKELQKMAKAHFTKNSPLVFQMPKLEDAPEDLPDILMDIIARGAGLRMLGRGILLNYNMERMIFHARME